MTKDHVTKLVILTYRVLIPAMAFIGCLVLSPIYTYGTLKIADVAELGIRLIVAIYFSLLSWGTSNIIGGAWDKDRISRYVGVIPRSLYLVMGVVFGVPGLIGGGMGAFIINTYITLILFPSFLGLFIGVGITVAFVSVWVIALARLWYAVYGDSDWGA